MYDINEICKKVNGVFSKKKLALRLTEFNSLKSAKKMKSRFFHT